MFSEVKLRRNDVRRARSQLSAIPFIHHPIRYITLTLVVLSKQRSLHMADPQKSSCFIVKAIVVERSFLCLPADNKLTLSIYIEINNSKQQKYSFFSSSVRWYLFIYFCLLHYIACRNNVVYWEHQDIAIVNMCAQRNLIRFLFFIFCERAHNKINPTKRNPLTGFVYSAPVWLSFELEVLVYRKHIVGRSFGRYHGTLHRLSIECYCSIRKMRFV